MGVKGTWKRRVQDKLGPGTFEREYDRIFNKENDDGEGPESTQTRTHTETPGAD